MEEALSAEVEDTEVGRVGGGVAGRGRKVLKSRGGRLLGTVDRDVPEGRGMLMSPERPGIHEDHSAENHANPSESHWG